LNSPIPILCVVVVPSGRGRAAKILPNRDRLMSRENETGHGQLLELEAEFLVSRDRVVASLGRCAGVSAGVCKRQRTLVVSSAPALSPLGRSVPLLWLSHDVNQLRREFALYSSFLNRGVLGESVNRTTQHGPTPPVEATQILRLMPQNRNTKHRATTNR
jgi:hypothetical protein